MKLRDEETQILYEFTISDQGEYVVEPIDEDQSNWQQQQTRINELEKMCNSRDEIIEELQEELKERQQKHLDSIRALRKANENVTKIAKDSLGLLSDIEALEAKLKVSDIRPMGESEYLERIEALKDELEDKCRTINNMRITIADLTEKLDIERNRTEELEELLKAYDIQAYSEGYQEGKKECLFETQEEHDRYELEQAIMSCWGITDDLHLLADAMESGEHKRMHHEMLLNLSQLYELKFQKLFKEFNKFTGCYL
jgi:uncharacterized coiled-coil DUF342 family protein